jgi:predicted membrane channel-forming protein YqfA (hemolysin III family)
MLTDYSRLFFISLLQLWWIALWGIAYIVIEYVSNKNRLIELYIYIGLLLGTVFLLVKNPQLLNHL